MNTNACSADVKTMLDLNSQSSDKCIAEWYRAPWWRRIFGTINPGQCLQIEGSTRTAALLMWGWKVRQAGDWDHKPKISAKFNKAWFCMGEKDYYYDIFSNLHYGYVGVAAGFPDGVLLDGAGLEQIGSDFVRKKLPSCSIATSGLRSCDDASDREAITIGAMLRRVHRAKYISTAQILEKIVDNRNLSTRPHARKSGKP